MSLLRIACRLWNLSLATVVILTFSNVLLIIRLLNSDECPQLLQPESIPVPVRQQLEPIHVHVPVVTPSSEESPPQALCSQHIFSAIVNISQPEPSYKHYNANTLDVDLRLGRWDARHMYKMFDFAVVGSRYAELSEKFSVCLATQSSLEKLHSLVQVAHHWSGPISAAVFAGGKDEYNLIQFYIAYLRRCYAVVKERVSFHLAYPKDAPRLNSEPDFKDLKLDCSRPETSLIKLVKLRKPETVKWRLKLAYPQNHMRNLARRNCQSGFVFLTDVDIIPSARQAESLDAFLKHAECKGKCAYVIPTYEIDDRVRFPHNKTDLIRLARKGLARPFHQKVFIYNQYATNFSRWEVEGPGDNVVHISHNVTNFEFLYEPFYVASDTVPSHDERFIGYGYTRNTQVYEMFVAGYQFQVLSPIFTCHWGLQKRKGRPSWREHQNSANRRNFEVFKSEVFARYHKDPLKMLQSKKATGGKSAAGVVH